MKKHNLDEVPAVKAIFGVFAIVQEEPINCRYIGETDNLKNAIQELFENPPSAGMKKFMQGPWFKILQFEELPDCDEQMMESIKEGWKAKFDPRIDDDGEYPGYYDY